MNQVDLIRKINDALPQTQCEKCDYPGCLPYANAIVKQGIDINRCQPGGQETIDILSALTGRPSTVPYHAESVLNQVAVINEDNCIGCMLCIKACPVDAIIGSSKQLHTVLTNACTGCGLCLPPCPTSCIDFVSVSTPNQHADHKIIYKTRYHSKQERDQKNAQKKLQKHFDFTNINTIQKTLATILNNEPK